MDETEEKGGTEHGQGGEDRFRLDVGGVPVDVVRKAIRHVHLAVYPPDGRVRLAIPYRVSDDAARLAVVDRLGWIRRQQAAFARQPRQSAREMVTGESHYVWGRRMRLHVVHDDGPAQVRTRGLRTLELVVRPETSVEQRERLLAAWHRERLKAAVPSLLDVWQPVLGVEAVAWGVRRMRTRWGSCNPDTGRLLFNTELAKKPPECLEFIVVHELVHLIERTHSERFRALMDRFLPDWPHRREVLNRAPLAHEDWMY